MIPRLGSWARVIQWSRVCYHVSSRTPILAGYLICATCRRGLQTTMNQHEKLLDLMSASILDMLSQCSSRSSLLASAKNLGPAWGIVMFRPFSFYDIHVPLRSDGKRRREPLEEERGNWVIETRILKCLGLGGGSQITRGYKELCWVANRLFAWKMTLARLVFFDCLILFLYIWKGFITFSLASSLSAQQSISLGLWLYPTLVRGLETNFQSFGLNKAEPLQRLHPQYLSWWWLSED